MVESDSPTLSISSNTLLPIFLTYNPPLGIKRAILINARRAGIFNYTFYSYKKSIY